MVHRKNITFILTLNIDNTFTIEILIMLQILDLTKNKNKITFKKKITIKNKIAKKILYICEMIIIYCLFIFPICNNVKTMKNYKNIHFKTYKAINQF